MYSGQANQPQRRPSGAPVPIPMSGNQTGYDRGEMGSNPYRDPLSPLRLDLDINTDHNQAGMPDDVFTSGSLRGGGQQHAHQNTRAGMHDDVFTSGRGSQQHAPQNTRVSGEGNFGSFNQPNEGPIDHRSPLSPSDPDMRQSSYPYHDQGNSFGTPTHPGGQPGMLHGNFSGGFNSAGSQANYLPGNRGRTPLVFNDQGGSRSQSVANRDGTLFDDYPSSYSSSRSQSRQPTHPADLPQRGYSRSSTSSLDGYPREQQDHVISQLVAEVKRLAEVVNQYTSANEDLKRANEELTLRLASTEHDIAAVRADISQMDTKTKQLSKTGANDHPTVKRLIHPLFADLCRIEQSLEKGQRALALGKIQPLENGKPYDVQVVGDKSRTIWHPNWKGSVDESLNVLFIKEIADKIWTNEMSRRQNPHTQGEIDDDSFSMETIVKCVKTYFRNIHKQVGDHANPERMAKAEGHQTTGRRRAQHAGVAKMRRRAAALLESEKPDMTDAVGLIDTDFCTDPVSYDEATLSDTLRQRRQKVDIGKGATIGVGYEWRSVEYVTFLRYLTLKATRVPADAQPGPADGQPPATKKARRTITNKNIKKSFDAPPSMLSSKGPKSNKRPDPTIPVVSMMDPKWRAAHPEVPVIADVEKCKWLARFSATLGPGDLLEEDVIYLKELREWKDETTAAGEEADDEQEY
ncbi:hypothetical protein PAXINDRAFT_158730 [Paxillus involutus ATCC 200175]|uniref:Uncharacterized protein n=1 Tax=Paxillus involutus ATCC 200175 TaxID=664439 RepID=A0A0C9SMM5_PAXIN|nr:hypothetical protein PAXINDRAFT_158730 [Paxillus involutus ATCC 200175]